MNIRLGNLKTGTWRNVTPDELKTLEKALGQTGTSQAERRQEEKYRKRQKEFFKARAEQKTGN